MMRRLGCVALALVVGCVEVPGGPADCGRAGTCAADSGPTITASTPASHATGVPLDTSLTLTFSEAMLRSSVQVALSPAQALATPTWTEDGTDTTVGWTFTGSLAPSTTYTVSVAGQSARGVALTGTTLVSFTTAAATDTTPPLVVATLPASASTGVATVAPLSVTFSERMGPATVNALTITPAVPCTTTLDATGTVLTCTHASQALQAGATYLVTVGTSAQDEAGNALAVAYTYSFQTSSTVTDTTPPTIVSTYPGHDTTGVAPEAPVSVTFSEKMSPATASAVTISPGLPCAWTFDASGTLLTCAHGSAALAADTLYTVTVTTAASDTAGNALATSYPFTFRTARPADTLPPTVATIPSHNGTGVPVDIHLVLTFSEPMDQPSVGVTSQPTFDWGTATWSPDGRTVSFLAPPLPLQGDTNYFMTLSAQDLAGNPLPVTTRTLAFKTALPPDTTAPTIVSIAPAEGATGVSVNNDLTIVFSEPMQAASASALSVSPTIPCTSTFDATLTVLTCEHTAQAFAAHTTYTVTVNTTASDSAGNALAAASVTTFQTGALPDTMPPSVASVVPTLGATGVAATAPIVVTFSEAVDQATAQAAFSITSPTGLVGTFSWSADSKVMTFQPTLPLPFGTNLSFQVGAGVRDLSNNASTVARDSNFKTINQGMGWVAALPSDVTLFTTALQSCSADTKTFSATSEFLAAGLVGATTSTLNTGALTFDLTSLNIPAGATIVGANLSVTGATTTGTPYATAAPPAANLGALIVRRTNGDTTVPAGLCAATCTTWGCVAHLLSTAAFDGLSRVAQVQASLAATTTGLVTFELAFSGATVPTKQEPEAYVTISSADSVAAPGQKPRLTLTWQSP